MSTGQLAPILVAPSPHQSRAGVGLCRAGVWLGDTRPSLPRKGRRALWDSRGRWHNWAACPGRGVSQAWAYAGICPCCLGPPRPQKTNVRSLPGGRPQVPTAASRHQTVQSRHRWAQSGAAALTGTFIRGDPCVGTGWRAPAPTVRLISDPASQPQPRPVGTAPRRGLLHLLGAAGVLGHSPCLPLPLLQLGIGLTAKPPRYRHHSGM